MVKRQNGDANQPSPSQPAGLNKALFDADWYVAHYRDVAESQMPPYEHYQKFGADEGRSPTLMSFEIRRLAESAFDTPWYLERYPDVKAAGLDAFKHYVLYGRAEGRSPSAPPAALFDADWYVAHYRDVAESQMPPYEHYQKFGADEGRSPTPMSFEIRRLAESAFDAPWYLEQYPDVKAAGLDAFKHYVLYGRAEGRSPSAPPAALFDADWYVAHYRDVAESQMPPYEHYQKFGADEGRSPTPMSFEIRRLAEAAFDAPWYLEQYPDVKAAGLDAFKHYVLYGRAEGRSPSAPPAALFDADWYVAHYRDVAESQMPPYEHYQKFGADEGRSPTPMSFEIRRLAEAAFDAPWYLERYPDVKAAGLDAFRHYVLYGRAEGRSPSASHQTSQLTPAVAAKNSVIPQSVLVSIPLESSFFASIKWIDKFNPDVSIVILCYRKPELVENLIKSILLFTTGFKYEIIVVDNGSPQGTHQIDRRLSSLARVITLANNAYIGDGYNIGVEQSHGAYIVLMNNDIVVQPNWLESLIQPLVDDPSIGAVGPKFLYPDGTLQEAGALIDEAGYSIQIGKHSDPHNESFNKSREVHYCTGATIAVRRDDFLAVLGYSWIWTPGYFEDADLCFELRARGLRVIYTPKSIVFHLESVTMRETPPTSQIGLAIDANRRQFVSKWADILKTGQFKTKTFDLDLLNSVKNALTPINAGEKTVAVYLPYEIIPGGGEKYILSIASVASAGDTVVIVVPHITSVLRIKSVMAELDVPHFNFRVITLAQSKTERFGLFFLIGNELFPQMSGLGDRSFYVCQFPFQVDHGTLSQRFDARHHQTYESYIAYSDFVKRHILNQTAAWSYKPDVQVLYPCIEPIGVLENNEKSNWLIGVGRFFVGGHNKRHDKLIEAYSILSDRLAKTSENVAYELHLAGAVHAGQEHRNHLASLKASADQLQVRFHVNATRAHLKQLYRQSKVYWHAAGWGVDPNHSPEQAEHFGITIVEAMSAGCIPVAFAVGGPPEIIQHGLNGFLVGSVDEMVDWTVRILRDWDKPAMKDVQQAAIATAERLSSANLVRRVEAVLAKSGDNLVDEWRSA